MQAAFSAQRLCRKMEKIHLDYSHTDGNLKIFIIAVLTVDKVTHCQLDACVAENKLRVMLS